MNSLWEVWERTLAAGPDRAAAIDAGDSRVFTRAELTAQAAAISAPAGLAPGDTVAFAMRNGVGWLALFFATQKLGAVALPLDAALPVDQQPAAAAALGAQWLVIEGVWRAIESPRNDGAACLIKTTSGTTGQPKPLRCTAANMLADGRQICAAMGIEPEDVNLGAAPFGHSYGLGNLVLPLIVQGSAIACSVELMPDAIASQIERCGVTVFPSAPAIFRALAESSVAAERLRSLRTVISAGAPLPAAVARAFWDRFGIPVHNFYGSSETGGICYDRTGEATASGRSIGTAIDGVEIKFAADGRVVVQSAAVVGEGSHTLPDLGRWNDLGELVLTGRLGALANIGGKKVAPLEIENVIRSLAGVTDAWIGVRSRVGIGGVDYLLAAVETTRSRDEILAELSARLPGWQIPRRLWVAASLPRTERGKLDRAALEAQVAGQVTSSSPR